jgi:putative glutamine amidotransferase
MSKSASSDHGHRLPLQLVLGHLAAPVIFPDIGLAPEETFRRYLNGLKQTATLTNRPEVVATLETASVGMHDAARHTDRPVVGIMLSDPNGLDPKDDTIPGFVRLARHLDCSPVLIPPRLDLVIPEQPAPRARALRAVVHTFDGLLGPGGDDVHPRLYNEALHVDTEGHPLARDLDWRRDRIEADIAVLALASDLFAFGICRSHQLWNAALGGTLVQDVRAEGYSCDTQNQEDVAEDPRKPFVERSADGRILFENRVFLDPDSRVARDLGGAVSLMTNSLHHQAVRTPGIGLKTVGAVRDYRTGVDTIEITEGWNVVTTQFHPELMRADGRPHQLLHLFGRRARIFALVRRMRHEGAQLSAEAIVAEMSRSPAHGFSIADEAWVRDDLAPRLTARAPAV